MTDQEILTKAIRKAIDGGWSGDIADKVQSIVDEDIELLLVPERNIYILGPINFIFSHEFAKALWDNAKHNAFVDEDGGTYACTKCGGGSVEGYQDSGKANVPNERYLLEYCWQWHLQQMVLAPDPIKYLGEHLDD